VSPVNFHLKLSHLYIKFDLSLFLVNPDDVSGSVREYLELDNCLESPCIAIKDYHLFIRELSNWKNPSRKWIIPQDINHAVYRYLTQVGVYLLNMNATI